MISGLIVLVACLLSGYLAFSPRLSQSSSWQATVTPLASIMGSGFLVSAPLLGGAVGYHATFCMVCLLVLAYSVGGAIRFNIRYFEPIENDGHGVPQTIAFGSRVVLAGAYIISVTYYLQLLSAFLLNAIGFTDGFTAHVITTGLLGAITGIGMWKGLSMLERVEKYAVAINLGMIGALLLSLAYYNIHLGVSGDWQLPAVSSVIDLHDLRVLLGLLIVVQGFETSRYLGKAHPPEQRIRTMKMAQILSAGIYIVFIGLSTVLFQSSMGSDVTAIITMTAPVAAVLPILLSVAAIGSQFSAAVADTEGCGGLAEDLTHGHLTRWLTYLLIFLATSFITWETDVNQIIAYASRAFSLYYMLQCLVAISVAWQNPDVPRRTFRLAMYSGLAIICFAVFSLGLPSE